MDGRSKQTFDFYNKNDHNIKPYYTWESYDSLAHIIKNEEKLVFLLNDYKSYTKLSVQQNWNAGKNSFNRVEQLNFLLEDLNYNFYLEDSYVSYPTFLYLLKRKPILDHANSSFDVWEHHLKDIILPIEHKGYKITSSVVLNQKDSLKLKDRDLIVINIEGDLKGLKKGDLVGSVESGENVILLKYRQNVWGVFAEFDNIEIDEEKVFYSWVHKPLVSGSINYAGSYFRHRANIYYVELNRSQSDFIIIKSKSKKNKLRVWL